MSCDISEWRPNVKSGLSAIRIELQQRTRIKVVIKKAFDDQRFSGHDQLEERASTLRTIQVWIEEVQAGMAHVLLSGNLPKG
jgi:hypothetical protein